MIFSNRLVKCKCGVQYIQLCIFAWGYRVFFVGFLFWSSGFPKWLIRHGTRLIRQLLLPRRDATHRVSYSRRSATAFVFNQQTNRDQFARKKFVASSTAGSLVTVLVSRNWIESWDRTYCSEPVGFLALVKLYRIALYYNEHSEDYVCIYENRLTCKFISIASISE